MNDPAVDAASGRYVLQQINGAGLPAITVPSPPNSCPIVTDNATLVLTARPQVFEVTENSRSDCRIGPSTTFRSTSGGSWSLQAGTVTFTTSGTSNMSLGQGTLSGTTLALTFAPPHVETGKTTDRGNSVWVK